MRRAAPAGMTIRYRDEIAIASATAVLYVSGIGWGLPYANHAERIRGWATDAITPLGPLTELWGIAFGYGPDAYLGYPLMHYFVLAGAYIPVFLYLWITGEFRSPTGQFPFGFANPVLALQQLEITARIVTLGMALVTVVTVYRIGTFLWGRRAGRLAAVFVSVLHPMVYYSRTGNLDVPVLMWTCLGIAVYVRALVDGLTPRGAVTLGALAAAAAATKEQAWGAFVLMPIPLFWGAWSVAGARRIEYVKTAAAGLLAFALCYSVASGLAESPARHLAHLRWMTGSDAFSLQRVVAASPGGYLTLFGMTVGYVVDAGGLLMLLSAAVGLIVAARRDRRHLALALPAIGHVLFVLMPVRVVLLRYVMLIAVIVALYAARAIEGGLASRRRVRLAAAAVSAAIVGGNLLVAADLTYQMWHDSRYAAAAWLEEHVTAGSKVGHAVSASSLPELAAGVHYRPVVGPSASVTIEHERPDVIILMPDWTSPRGGTRPHSFPAATERALLDGSLGYRLAARFRTNSALNVQKLDYPTVNPPIYIFTNLEALTLVETQ